MLPAFTCARVLGNLWSISVVVNILKLECFEKPVPPILTGNILLPKVLRTLSLPSKGLYKFSRTSSFCWFFSVFFSFTCFLKSRISTNESIWSLSASCRVVVPL